MSATPAVEPEIGAPFLCPNCGAADWKADYYEAVWQGAIVLIGADGKPDVVDYNGVTGSYDDGASGDEQIVCNECGHEVDLEKIIIGEQEKLDAAALDEIAEILRRPTWPGGADFLEWTNEIVRKTGRNKEEPS